MIWVSHVLDNMPDHMLDHMIIGLVTMALQLLISMLKTNSTRLLVISQLSINVVGKYKVGGDGDELRILSTFFK